MDEPEKPGVDRRSFLTGAVTGAAAALIAQQTSVAGAQPAATTAEPVVQANETGRHASDFMVDIFKSLDMEYMFSMCASSFMGIHESVLNYAGNKSPQSITCTHEEISVAMANGYAKIEGKPVLVCAHATVGAQHAAMALYDAWCDRVPIYLVLGNTNDAADRQGEVFWLHSAQDPGALVREFTKWDDNPASLTHFAESAVRAYKIAMTPPMGPVAIVVDEKMQEEHVPADTRIPKLSIPTPPAGDSGAIAELAKLLVAAENPVILAGRAARTPAGLRAHGRARRDAASGRRRHAPTSELSDAPSLERRLAGPSRRRARARGRRHLERHAPSAATQRESSQPHRHASLSAQQLPGLHALRRGRHVDRGRRRSVVAGVDRGDPASDDEHAAGSVPPARRARRRSESRDVRASAHRRNLRLGREPRQHRAVIDGAVGTAQERGLVVRDRLGQLAAAALGLHEAPSVHRPRRRRGRRLLRARRPWAPHSPTRSTGASACRFNPTAT